MKTTAIISSRFPTLTPGTYPGKWMGYLVIFEMHGATIRLESTEGARGLCLCTVTINPDGEITVESKE